MKVTRRDSGPTKTTLSVQADSDDLEPIYKHVLSHFSRSVKVPGFRKGKAPAHLVEKSVDQQALLDEFMEHALNSIYRQAVGQEKIRPISVPKVELKKFVPYSLLEFEAETEILGNIKLPDYKKIKINKPKISVTAQEISNVIKNLQERLAIRNEVVRPAKNGDEVVIDFSGYDTKDDPVSGADGKDMPLLLGSKSFIPGFEDNLIGVKTGEERDFEIVFPSDYSVESLRDKPIRFKVLVKKLNQLTQPKVDDDFARKAGPFKDLNELKADIKKQLQSEKKSRGDSDYQNQLMRKIAEKTQIEVPESLIAEENQRLEDQEKQNLAYRGQTWQEHLKQEGVTEEEHRQRHYPEALERVKVGLILSEIADKESITVNPEEVEVRITLLKNQYQDPQMRAELDKESSRRDIESRLLTEKTLARLTDTSAG